MRYQNKLTPVENPIPILADFPQYVEPLQPECRWQAPPLIDESDGALLVRSWRYWYNARGIVEFDNRLNAEATAVLVVHPWGIDDDHGLCTPEPAGCRFFCTTEKNAVGHAHMRDVINPFLQQMRPLVNVVGYSLPAVEDPIRRKLYASVNTEPEELDIETGERELANVLRAWSYRGQPLVTEMELDDRTPVKSYFTQAHSTDAGEYYSGSGFQDLPMPMSKEIKYAPQDRMFYDAEGYAKIRDYLLSRGVRHVLLAGYSTDMCVISTTCGYQNLSNDFNVFIVGDATLATYPGSITPRFATQTALANAALMQMMTQVSWIRLETGL